MGEINLLVKVFSETQPSYHIKNMINISKHNEETMINKYVQMIHAIKALQWLHSTERNTAIWVFM